MLSQKALQKKREKRNNSRKGKVYNAGKRYYAVQNGRAVEQAGPVYNPDKDSITL